MNNEKEKLRIAKLLLEKCYEKIDIYNKAYQQYLGGTEATTLLRNIHEFLELLNDSE